MTNTYPFMYLGLCINNNDPERRGRVQVFVPHIMPALYDGWNKEGNDINITCVGSNLQNGLTDEQIAKLRQILPWAEAASPICGGSAPGNLLERAKNAVTGAISSVFGYDQTPTATPVLSSEAPSLAGQLSSPGGMQYQPTGGAVPVTDNPFSGGIDPAATNTVTPSVVSGSSVGGNPNLNYISQTDLHAINLNAVAQSGLVGFVPADGANYGITTGSAEEWAAYFDRQAPTESSTTNGYIAVNEKFTESNGVVSQGLYSLTVGEHGLTNTTIQDPVANTNAAVNISANLIKSDGVIAGQSSSGGWLGAARYFGPLRKGEATINGQTPDTFNKIPTSIVNKTNPYGTIATQNLNNTAKGLFTYPAAGAMLWVFFREGNPLYPVYFAASYSNDEWKSAYRYQSPVDGYSNNENGISSTKTFLNLQGGGISTHSTQCPSDPTKNQQSLMLFGSQGSNIAMHDDHDQYFSKFSRRDQVEGDRWTTTLGYREDWIQGDHNHVTVGDTYIKIGNVSQSAVDAVTRIQQLIKDGHKPLTELK